MECKICNKFFKSFQGLQSHISQKHKEITVNQYYDLFLKKEVKCKICKEKPKFISILKGYSCYCKECHKNMLSSSFRLKHGITTIENSKKHFDKISKKLKETWKKREINQIKNHFTPTSLNFWVKKGYSKEDGEKERKKYLNKLWDKNKYYRKNEPERFSNTLPSQVGYWIKKGYSKEEAIKKVSEIQSTFTLEKCIKKYGDIRGRKRFKERQDKWQKTLQSRDDYEEIKIKRIPSKVSKSSQLFFWELYKKISKKGIYFHELNKEYIFSKDKKVFFLDFFDKNKKLCIEYNGNYWHENKERRKLDRIKEEKLNEYDIKVLTIWESDVNNNINNEIERCLRFLNE